MKKLILFLFIAAGVFPSFSQTTGGESQDSISFFNMSIEELLNVEISVAAKKPLTLRESPGIITLITQDEIRNSGAHDLMEVLRTVPGLYFGVDVEGVVGIGVRGNWGHEGKVLLMYDGQEMNEQLFSTLQFGEHYPIDQIKKIEIVRGPGSCVYGANAEYAVINVITNNSPDFQGISSAVSYGQMQKTYASRSVSVNGGHHFGSLAVNAGLYAGEGNRSDRVYSDYFGKEYDMTNDSYLNNYLLNFSADYKGLSFRFLGDYYQIEQRDGYDEAMSASEPMYFNSEFFDLKYKWKISEKFYAVPQLKYKEQDPWKVYSIVSPDDISYYKEARKPSANLTMHYDLRGNMEVEGGAEYYLDQADDINGGTFENGKTSISYYNTSFFMQGLWRNKVANLTLGARYHLNNAYDPSFVPRIGITKVLNRTNFKLLYSVAYRAPSIENIRLGNDIQPERTNVAEFETGYQFSNNSYITANIFDITSYDAIVYFYDRGTEGYHNAGSTGTRGFEIDYKIKRSFGYADFNVAYYTARGKQKTESYQVTTNENLLLAFPGIVTNAVISLRVNQYISLNPSLTWMGSRYDFLEADAEGVATYKKYKPELMANVFAGLQHPKLPGISASVGCANIMNVEGRFIQPYNSNHASLPGRSREFRITLRYDFESSKK
jgi:outer membrane cobalamin receptor